VTQLTNSGRYDWNKFSNEQHILVNLHASDVTHKMHSCL